MSPAERTAAREQLEGTCDLLVNQLDALYAADTAQNGNDKEVDFAHGGVLAVPDKPHLVEYYRSMSAADRKRTRAPLKGALTQMEDQLDALATAEEEIGELSEGVGGEGSCLDVA